MKQIGSLKAFVLPLDQRVYSLNYRAVTLSRRITMFVNIGHPFRLSPKKKEN